MNYFHFSKADQQKELQETKSKYRVLSTLMTAIASVFDVVREYFSPEEPVAKPIAVRVQNTSDKELLAKRFKR